MFNATRAIVAASISALSTHAAAAGVLTPVYLDGANGPDAYLETTANVMWYRQANIDGAMRFTPANEWAQAQTFAGFTEWRLPTLVELQDLYATLGNVNGVMNSGPFEDVTPGQYWSTTKDGSNIFGLDTRTGYTVSHVDEGASLYAWAVANPIPEPGTLALLGAGLLPILAVSRRRTRRGQLRA